MALASRVAVITGAGVGIGRAVAARFAAEGARVVVADKHVENGQRVVEEIERAGGQAIFQEVDVRDLKSVQACFENTHKEFGGVHVLVNNAVNFMFGHLGTPGEGSGKGTDKPITAEDWETAYGVNIMGYANCIQEAFKYMKENELTDNIYENNQGHCITTINAGSRGSIINMCSVSGYMSQPEFVPYNVTKGGVMQMTRCVAQDFAPHKIRVNGICPGTIETPGSYNHMILMDIPLEQGKKQFASQNVLKRQGSPEEVANGALFLASDEASFVTGSHLVIDGGETFH